MKFEEKISTLEQLINDLESNNVSLEDSIEKYTKAMKLVKECDEKLKSIEENINKIVKENGLEEDLEIND